MRRQYSIIGLFFLILMGLGAYAQDPHFTQAHRIPTWYNPAASGHNVEHIRLTMLYRNQWSSVMSPFKTEGVFFDKQVSKVGFGANIVNNSAGESGMRQMFLNGQLSYRHAFGRHMLASGIQIGFIQKSFDPSKMTFDDQYTPDNGFDPSNPTSESFSYTKLTRPDFGLGFLWTYGKKGKNSVFPFAGISMQHLNQPKESYIEQNNFIPRKITANAGAGFVMKNDWTITPAVQFSKQQFAQEFISSVMIRLPMEDRNNLEGGIIFRNNDAIAIYTGYQWNSFMAGISYDINISGATGGPGAFEISLTYIPKARPKKEEEKKKQKPAKEAKKDDKKSSTASKVPVTSSNPTPVQSQPAETKKPDTGKPTGSTPLPAAKPAGKPVTKPAPAKPATPPAPAPKATTKPAPAAPIENITLAPIRKVAPVTMPAVNKPQPVSTKAIKSASIPVREIPDQPETDKSSITLLEPRKNVTKVKVTVPELRPTGDGKNLTAGVPDLKPEAESSVPTVVAMPDADGDGIADSKDKCPYMKGEPGTGGCPDTDKDGIPDTDDQCPMVAGTKENNGCATEKSIAEAGTSSAEHIGNIEFKTGSAEVHGLYKLDIIEPALDSLLEDNSMMLVITGHTDNEGDAPFNMHLSQSRADVVKAIFMKKGLPEERITTVAYGENMPIRDNVSDEGKQRNRRVEVHIIRKEKQ